MESVVRDQPRVRPRVFSTPRRFAQARVPRPCFVPQPDPGLSVLERSPRRDRAPVPRPLAPLRFLTRAPNATSSTLSPSVSLHRHAPKYCYPLLSDACQLSSPADYGLPFGQPRRLASQLPWVDKTVIARSASSAPFEALIPLRVRSRSAGLPRPYGRCSILVPFRDSPPPPRILEPAA